MALPQRDIEHFEKDAHSEDEYFEFERRAFGRWEFVPTGPPAPEGCRLGDIRAMSGGTPARSATAMSVARLLGNALVARGRLVYGSDLKVHTGDGVNTFPDVSVVCGPLSFHANRKDAITNPLLVVEVLSDSTEDCDRNAKFEHYQSVRPLTDYLLVSQDRARRALHPPGGLLGTADRDGRDGSVHLRSVDVALALSDIYALIEMEL